MNLETMNLLKYFDEDLKRSISMILLKFQYLIVINNIVSNIFFIS